MYVCCLLILIMVLHVTYLFCLQADAPRLTKYNSKKHRYIQPKELTLEISADSSQRRNTVTTDDNASKYTDPNKTRVEDMIEMRKIMKQVYKSRERVVSTSANDSQMDIELKEKNKELYKEIEKENKEINRKNSILAIIKTSIYIRILLFASLISGFLFIYTTMINQTLTIFSTTKLTCKQRQYSTLFLLLQRMSLHTFFLARLHFGFQKSLYECKKIYVIILVILINGSFIASLLYLFSLTLLNECNDSNILKGIYI